MQGRNSVLSWLHIGDLHITREGERNHLDLQRIVELANGLPAGSLDFAVLPGDNADDGTRGQFRLVREAVAPLALPLHILAGDHDFKSGSLDGFHDVLGAERLPKAVCVRGHRCLFLDVVSTGSGGPDFRLGQDQLAWAERQLRQAEEANQAAVIFMHTYPADLREGGGRLVTLLAQPHVACVDMGHTHYNELTNDGRKIFMATRSTGQAEEGPAGFSIAAIDGRGVSWRFKPLARAWPFVLVTHPVDRRLATDPGQTIGGRFTARAKVLGDVPIETVEVRLDNGDWMPMTPVPAEVALWEARVETPGRCVRVRARDTSGREDEDWVTPAGEGWTPADHAADGSDRDRVGAWLEKGILGTQLGPNRNGRTW